MKIQVKTLQVPVYWVVLVLVVVALGFWQLGARMPPSVNSRSTTGPAGSGATSASLEDPGSWSMAQGEDATRRHLREGLKAGDMDLRTGRTILYYVDPMVPGKNFEAPGKSPFMDMMLVPRYAGAGDADAGLVSVSPRIQQNLGLRTATVMEGVLQTGFAAVGDIAWNERLQTTLSSRAMGYVEKLHVRAVLDGVAKDQPLLDIYVPDWVAAQEDYLAITRMQGTDLDVLRKAALQRMRQVGMSEEQIRQVTDSGTLHARLTLRAPQAGVLTELMVREGGTVMPGMLLLRLQGTQTVWAEAEVPESQIAELRPGMAVRASSPAFAGVVFEGRVQALLPQVDASTRTLKARLELRNPDAKLVPGMLVQMQFAGATRKATLLVPSEAVIRTGQRNMVMLAEENGYYRPVEVKTGREADGKIEILSGLDPGQNVVVSGQFLIDSEASLRGLVDRLNQGPAQAAKAATQTYATDAVIEKIQDGAVTLTHQPVPALKWPGMTMDFRLPPAEQGAAKLATGEKVRIEFRMQDGEMPLITRLERLSSGGGQ
ncbi:MAG: efflux RND transporter periplasmic adaptor subunit [Burkholderiales bacterium]|nr:efflux RND transporter periplasmic adaptor subunit [Burkholderiales bacterium]